MERATAWFVVAACLLATIAATGVAAAATGPATAEEAVGGPKVPASAADESANATVWTAPGDARDRLTDATAIQQARADRTLVSARTVDISGTLVLELDVPGLGAAIENASGPNATARLDALLEDNRTNIDAVQQNPTVERTPLIADLVDSSATTVVRDGNDTVYLVLETAEIPARHDGKKNWTALETQAYYEARFAVNVTHRNATATTAFVTEEPEVAFLTAPGSDQPHVRPAPDATIRARTNMAPGTSVRVSVVDASGDVVREATTTVGADRQLSVSYNLSEFRGEIALRLVPFVDNRQLDGVQATVAEAVAKVTMDDQRRSGQAVTVELATLSHGGILAIHRGSPDGPVVAQTLLPVGSHADIELQFSAPLESNATLVAVPYRDVNGNGTYDASVDPPYNVTAVADYTVEQAPSSTPTRTATPTPGSTTETTAGTTTETTAGTTTDATTQTPTATTGVGTTSDSGPGFGGVIALVSLVGGIVAARRRHES